MPPWPGHPAQEIENKAKQVVGGIRLSTRLAFAMVSLVLVTTAVLSFIHISLGYRRSDPACARSACHPGSVKCRQAGGGAERRPPGRADDPERSWRGATGAGVPTRQAPRSRYGKASKSDLRRSCGRSRNMRSCGSSVPPMGTRTGARRSQRSGRRIARRSRRRTDPGGGARLFQAHNRPVQFLTFTFRRFGPS